MVRAIIAVAAITYALAVAQTTLGGRIAVWGVSPDLLLVWTVCVGLLAGPEAGAVVGFASGALQGSLEQRLVGALGISKTLSGLAAGLLASRVYRDNWLVPAVGAFGVTVLNETLFLAFSGFVAVHHAGRIIGLRALYHAALAPVLYAFAARAQRALLAPRAPVA